MRELPAVRLDPPPATGRRFTSSRPVRVASASPNGRLRLDAIAAMAQDVAGDDSADAGLGQEATAWVVRRTVIEVEQPAVFTEQLEVMTWCSGVGSRWAERRTRFRGDRGARIETVALWVHVDAATGRAISLPAAFDQVWAASAGGREVSSRFQHPPSMPDAAHVAKWAARFVDFDVLGHVNNAATWAMVEQAIADHDGPGVPHRAELEYRHPIERGDDVAVAIAAEDGTLRVWIIDVDDSSRVFATAVVNRSGSPHDR
ncbi:MAG: hypothetical protein HYX32_13545 [Actinobacteria bacterium]|nr:hypothetical protein [Actinomycetota bacterium]